MRRPLILLLALLAAVALAGCARDEARASGTVERWLQAVSDEGRDALASDARARAAEYGDPSLHTAVVPANAADDERTFSDLEVGRATEGPLGARVPFRVTVRVEGDAKEEHTHTAVLARRGDGWFVTGIEAPTPGEQVPSAGGDLPARASGSQWLLALLAGIAITAVSVVVIEAQPATSVGKHGTTPPAPA